MWSLHFAGVEFLPGRVANVDNLHQLTLLHNPVNRTIDVRLIAIKQVPQMCVFGCAE
jgi:hypothetical protein